VTDQELEKFEQQLRRTKPAKPPELFAARLLAAELQVDQFSKSALPGTPIPDYLRLLRQLLQWFIPATAVALVAVGLWRGRLPTTNRIAGSEASDPSGPPALTANDVKIDQQLVSSFDAVAKLPSGEPVRFRCENWMDQVVLSDKSRGLIVENRQPRFEVVALGFDTY
jgi:hypothetical protein